MGNIVIIYDTGTISLLDTVEIYEPFPEKDENRDDTESVRKE